MFDFLCVCVEEIGGLSPFFSFFFSFSLDASINYPDLSENAQKYKSKGTHLHRHTSTQQERQISGF